MDKKFPDFFSAVKIIYINFIEKKHSKDEIKTVKFHKIVHGVFAWSYQAGNKV